VPWLGFGRFAAGRGRAAASTGRLRWAVEMAGEAAIAGQDCCVRWVLPSAAAESLAVAGSGRAGLGCLRGS